MANYTSTANRTNWFLYGSQDNITNNQFYSHYYAADRIITECILAGIAILINLMFFCKSNLKEHQYYSYYALFRNFTFANAMFCLTLLSANNILYLFEEVKSLRDVNVCYTMSAMCIVYVANTLFGLASSLTLMGFSIVHYIAVVQPLVYPVRVNRITVNAGLVIIWASLSSLALIPISIAITRLSLMEECRWDVEIFQIGELSRVCMNINIAILQLIVILIVVFCVRIHVEIRKLQSRLNRLNSKDEMELEKRTFRSILLLVGTLALFFLPFNIMYVVSVNQDGDDMMNNKHVVYYMTLTPYLKFILDPLLYRKTVIDLQQNCKHCLCSVWRIISCKFVRKNHHSSSGSYKTELVILGDNNRQYKLKIVHGGIALS